MPTRRLTVPNTSITAATPPGRQPPALSGTFGEGEGRDLQQAGQSLQQTGNQLLGIGAKTFQKEQQAILEAAQRIKLRNDTLDRARVMDETTRGLSELFQSEVTTGTAFGTPESLENFASASNAIIRRGLESHRGSQESLQQLSEELSVSRNKFTDAAAARSVKTGFARVEKQLNTDFAKIADFAASAIVLNPFEPIPPDTLDGLLLDVVDSVEKHSGAMTPELRDGFVKMGTSTVVGTVLDSLIARGSFTNASDVLTAAVKSPLVDGILTPSQVREFNNRIVVGQIDFEKSVLSKREDIQRSAPKLSGPGEIALGLAPFVREGNASPEDVSRFLQAASELSKPDALGNPRPLSLPIQLALEEGLGINVENLGQPAALNQFRNFLQATEVTEPVIEDEIDIRDSRLSPQGDINLSPKAREASTVVQELSQALPQNPDTPLTEAPRVGFFQLADKLTGPISGVEELLSDVPILGASLPAADVVQARQLLEVFNLRMVRNFQRSPKFAEAERQDVTDIFALTPSLLSEPTNLKNRLIAIDDALAGQLVEAQESLAKGQLTPDQRKRLVEFVDETPKIRALINAPRLVSTPEEYRQTREQLPDGTELRTPTGKKIIIRKK